MKRFFHILLWLLAAILLVAFIGFGYAWINEWEPEEEEAVYSGDHRSILPDTLSVLSWNTGYAGLGDDMDFFMDGGEKTRTSRKRTENNFREITEFLQSCGADIILLQEVDRPSRRSYHTDQFLNYQEALPDYHGYFALNYKSPFVPVPLLSPVGGVESGIAIFSRWEPQEVTRYQYPSRFGFPVSLFNLKRGMLSCRFTTVAGGSLLINNTHNTAYDSGGMRTQEMEWLRNFLAKGYDSGVRSITGGDWNQYPPGYAASADETENPYFVPIGISADFFPPGWHFGYDASVATNRYLYEPLQISTTRTLLDFFLVSPGIRFESIRTVDLGFVHTDHNPVVATFIIDRES